MMVQTPATNKKTQMNNLNSTRSAQCSGFPMRLFHAGSNNKPMSTLISQVAGIKYKARFAPTFT